MEIREVIQSIKNYTSGMKDGVPVNPDRDKILWGSDKQECTGIVSTVFASIEVIKKAREVGANLIICNESLLYAHGDPTDWLEENTTFQYKRKLLDEGHICVWRFHEYSRAGIRDENGEFYDPTNWGLLKKLGWTDRILKPCVPDELNLKWLVVDGKNETVHDIAEQIVTRLNLNGVAISGNSIAHVSRMFILPGSLYGNEFDQQVTALSEENNFECLIMLGTLDYTTMEYVRDSAMLNRPRAIIKAGHFNVEEAGMEYAAQWFHKAVGNDQIPIFYVNSGDPYQYIIR